MREDFIARYVEAKAQAWTHTNNEPVHSHHPPRNRQTPSEQHRATWASEAAAQPGCPRAS
jgi:hypothetical protein